MGPLLPIITKSIMGNNESIITHYEPDQLADALCGISARSWVSLVHMIIALLACALLVLQASSQ